jgi:YD repeat-containing protein
MRSAFLVALIIICTCYSSFAQTTKVIPGSPEATNLGKYINYPVDLMTGVPAVNIPLYTIELRGGSFPISLNYHASGMKPDEMGTSLVGAGWSLSAEPLVSRKINSKPDEYGGGYLNNPNIMQANTWDYYGKIANGSFEEDADKFYYKLLSKSGSFYLKKNASGELLAKTIPVNGVKLDGAFTTNAHYNQLKLYDEDGSIYYFGSDNNGNGALESTYPPEGYRNCWKASRVELPQTAEVIYYKYYNAFQQSKLLKGTNISVETFPLWSSLPNECGTSNPYRNAVCEDPCQAPCPPYYRLSPVVLDDLDGTQKYLKLNSNNELVNEPCSVDYPMTPYRFSNVERRLLKEIIFPNGRIEFTTIIIQAQQMLTAITVYKSDNQKVKEFKFSYTPASLLKSIELYGADGVMQQAYQFAYHNLSNTDFFSYTTDAIDTWGYFNGRMENLGRVPLQTISTIKETKTGAFPPVAQENVNVNIGSAIFREPNEVYAKNGMLREIIYPTGGITRFDYELNQYKTDAGIIQSGGGLRIKNIVHLDGMNNVELKKNYKYGENEDGAGLLRHLPDISDYAYDYQTWYYPDGGENPQCTGWHIISNTKNYTSGLIDLFYDNGAAVVYKKVTEYIGDSLNNVGKTENFYETDNYKPFRRGGTDVVVEHPFSGLTGRLVMTKDYKNVGGTYTPVRIKENVYQAGPVEEVALGRKVFSKIRLINLTDATEYYLRSGYPERIPQIYDQYQIELISHFSHTEKLIQETEKLIVGSGELITVKKYKYGNTTAPTLVTEIETSNSKNELQTESIYYTNEIVTKGASMGIAAPIINTSQALLQNNVLNYLVYKKITKNSALQTLINTPNPDANIIKAETFVNNNPANSIDFTYDSNKRLIQQQAADNVKLSYLWDYSGQYPVAEVKNAAATSIAYSSFEADGSGNWYLNQPGLITTSDALTGKKSFAINGILARYSLDPALTYIVSIWTKNGIPNYSGFNGATQVIPDNNNWTIGVTVNGWTYREKKFTGVTTINIFGGGGLVDEARLYPANAQMTTYTYEPLIGMTSQCDVNNRITYYEYDGFGRLKTIRDENKNVLKTIDYQYQKNQNQ